MLAPTDFPIVTTMSVGLLSAFVGGLIAAKLKIPRVIGYLLGGIAIGPYTPGFVADLQVAEELSEIGIVLLMFGVGLHFSISDLWKVKGIAVPGAIGQMAAATLMGAIMAQWWGWDLGSGLMFGFALSVASTVVLLRALKANGLLGSVDGRIAIGWLIVEDLAMIVALVMLPVLAGLGGSLAEGAHNVALALGQAAAFVTVMVLAGKRVLPWLLKVVSDTGSRELFTLAIFALAVGLAFCASQLFGISLALGAFFAGMMIRESDYNHQVEERVLPFQDIFAVLFFVSVGMLVNPFILMEKPWHVLGAVGIIMVGKALVAFIIVLLAGYKLRTGLFVSAGLAQVGEFSFILAAVGVSTGLLPEEGRSLILIAALISIALNPVAFRMVPLMHKVAERVPVFRWAFGLRASA